MRIWHASSKQYSAYIRIATSLSTRPCPLPLTSWLAGELTGSGAGLGLSFSHVAGKKIEPLAVIASHMVTLL